MNARQFATVLATDHAFINDVATIETVSEGAAIVLYREMQVVSNRR